MDDPDELAPAVRSILSAARERANGGPGAEVGRTVSVAPRDLAAAFERAEADGRVPVIAEVKPTSPTTEGTREEDPVALAQGMVAGGAAALSVLTEPEHFGGSVDTLDRVRDAVDVPVLRKDFVVDEAQLDAVESDVVLLIARFVGDDLGDLLAAARDRGFQVLVEVHDREELERALDADATTIGINNRDLAELAVDLGTFESVAPHVPDEVTLIAESGIGSPADVRRMRAAGADALLVGSAIMDGDVEANTRELVRAEADDGGAVADDGEGDGEDDANGGSDTRDTTETPT
ncbi:indole-3-glycerol phosphate synthase [Halorubrum trapanicum]|uniref:Indole-3-glycerol phosphate synthase n=1 Tax=Halorubrum trapanicum TaxID=29284 RepID=A0A8J7UL16_9EURY|nr:indole-3-glycerol phosphate synthase [Halorubrum trapanicum]MBP1900604.1 indole-3-glycerol phosphate synthase [Halorubrum trapanicum]